jgi:hypothetical protein
MSGHKEVVEGAEGEPPWAGAPCSETAPTRKKDGLFADAEASRQITRALDGWFECWQR